MLWNLGRSWKDHHGRIPRIRDIDRCDGTKPRIETIKVVRLALALTKNTDWLREDGKMVQTCLSRLCCTFFYGYAHPTADLAKRAIGGASVLLSCLESMYTARLS